AADQGLGLGIGSPIRLAPSDDHIDGQSFQNCTKMYDTRSIPDSLYKVSRGSRFDDDDDDFVTLGWSTPDCRDCEAKRMGCRFKNNTQPPASFYVFTLYKKDREQKLRIREFLKDYFALKPSRYTYSDIKKFTNNFKEKLGEGAYGTVFKGKLSNKVMVAVKILNDTSKGNDGEEFLNEVATIGQIHHVNVVRLVGYCAEGFKRALVYEFLPNGSLHNYISLEASESEHQYSTLSWETLQDVAKGVAKGIEYLHQGCEQRILHFDIKPHNVLLDHNFKPKVSDFGLAKLCSRDQSLVSVTTARGTLGYMAPEVFSKNFGNVSYKSDVYSFGMLLLKIVGGQNITSKTDEIYYPEWIYNLLEEGESFEALIENEEDRKIAKKLATIGFWCIQWHPIGRPAMKTVVQMLETEEILNLPPNPFCIYSTPICVVPICVVCMNNTTLVLTSESDEYPYNFTVVGINYNDYTIRVEYPNLHNNNHDCSSIPNQYDMNLLSTDSELEIVTRIGEDGLFRWRKFKTYPISEYIIFLICENKVYNNPLYIDPSPCINISTFGFGSGSGFVYVVYASGFKYSDLGNSCRLLQSALISKGFNTKLGEGGFGTVYNGKLRSGHFVAIKMLDKSNTNWQDLINEVITIGKIHHVHVVRLVDQKINDSLSDLEIFNISLGIARGIAYLHEGCDMQILHFDIKPHNIFLDENLIPKVSDFGLARLCPLERNTVSLTAVRGTTGYIAPELFYKNI
ncbi:hypothetical protein G4B88_007036, partial [Cannabis sativa]